jgi:uncharacterized protein YecT (DUF1311 family)
MNRIHLILFLIFNLNSFSQTQAEMNKEAYAEFNESDKRLNEIYKTILLKYKTDTIFVENLKKSQRIWIRFRNAEMEMKYPNDPKKSYGSIYPTCRAFYLKEITDNRIKTLNIWVRGIEEGEVCLGSVRTLESIDYGYMGKANIKKNHRIFGYKEKDIYSEKMILLSIFTNEVENNPFECKYGAFYDTNGMKEISLKYISNEGKFLKIEIINEKEGKSDISYMLKKWFEFEE